MLLETLEQLYYLQFIYLYTDNFKHQIYEVIQLFKAIGSKINRFISNSKSTEIKVEKIEIEETEKTEIEK